MLYLIDLSKVQLDETGQVTSSWVQALPPGEYQHPIFGKLQITADKIKNLAESVKQKYRGIDPSINYAHKDDGEAAGWVKDAEARDTGLWLFVEWTSMAAQKIKEKAFRYFSAEFYDKWKNPEGKEFQDVLFGGALTNRPYMKNLLPVNLSEDAIQASFGLVDAINKGKEGQTDMDVAKFAKALGLAETASEDEVFTALAEKLNPTPPDPGSGGNSGKEFPQVPAVSISAEMKKMAEDNPLFKSLVEMVDAQNSALTSFKKELQEAEISKKFAEFDNSKIILTPVVKDKVHDLLVEMPVELHERLWDILGQLRNNSGLMVELGERAGANPRYGTAKGSVDLFLDMSNELAKEKKISLDEAMAQVSRERPDLYQGYRSGSYSFSE